MTGGLARLADALLESELREGVIHALGTVPGLPPLLQSVHILSVAVVVCAFVVPQMRILGIAAQRQSYTEMVRRLMPWGYGALLVLLASGAVFVIARPYRYLQNPVAGIKLLCFVSALGLSMWLVRRAQRSAPLFSRRQRLLAVSATLSWVGVILAGRWIAYVDYLFWNA